MKLGIVASEEIESVICDLFPGGRNTIPELADDLAPNALEFFRVLSSHPEVFVRGNASFPTAGTMMHFHLPSESEAITRWLSGTPRIECLAPGLRIQLERRRGEH